MISINLSGITFLDTDIIARLTSGQIKIGDSVTIHQTGDLEETYSGDYSVRAGDIHIGWIPQLGTIMRYMNKANLAKSHIDYKRQDERYCLVETLRGNIVTDLRINGIDPKGQITQVLFRKDESFYEQGEDQTGGKLASVSVTFPYPYP